jgi:hypothetical protein
MCAVTTKKYAAPRGSGTAARLVAYRPKPTNTRGATTMINPSSTPLIRMMVVCCSLQMMFMGTEAAAQEPLRLSATAQQGAVATYSEPLDVRRHTLWGDRRAALDLRTLRMAGTVRNAGDAPVRLEVFAVPEEVYQELARGTAGTSYPLSRRFLALFSIEIRDGAAVDLGEYAPRHPAALQRMMSAGPVRFGLIATSLTAERAVRIEAFGSPRGGQRTIGGSISGGGQGAMYPSVSGAWIDLRARSRTGEVSLLEARAIPSLEMFFPGEIFFRGESRFVARVDVSFR